jgi:hypothetical protein
MFICKNYISGNINLYAVVSILQYLPEQLEQWVDDVLY